MSKEREGQMPGSVGEREEFLVHVSIGKSNQRSRIRNIAGDSRLMETTTGVSVIVRELTI